jgi:hypothetical protein
VLSLLPSLRTILLGQNRIADIGHNTFANKVSSCSQHQASLALSFLPPKKSAGINKNSS